VAGQYPPLCRGGISDAQYECGFGISPHISCTSNVGIDEVKAKVRTLDEKFNTMQSLFDSVMTKLDIMVEGMASAPSRGENPPNVDKRRSNSCRIVCPIVRSISKEHVSKLLDFDNASEKPIVLSTEIPCGSQKISLGHEEPE
jgi:hypothetical protein